MKTKNIFRIGLITALILLVPFLAMQFDWRVPDPGSSTSDKVNWDLRDFVVMGTLIFSTGLALDLVASKVDKRYRVVVGAAIIAAFFLIWAELAVGVFTDWGS